MKRDLIGSNVIDESVSEISVNTTFYEFKCELKYHWPQVVRFRINFSFSFFTNEMKPKNEKIFTPKNIAFEKDKNEMSLKRCVKRVQCHHIGSTCQMLIAST
jgi:hypothetical protein